MTKRTVKALCRVLAVLLFLPVLAKLAKYALEDAADEERDLRERNRP